MGSTSTTNCYINDGFDAFLLDASIFGDEAPASQTESDGMVGDLDISVFSLVALPLTPVKARGAAAEPSNGEAVPAVQVRRRAADRNFRRAATPLPKKEMHIVLSAPASFRQATASPMLRPLESLPFMVAGQNAARTIPLKAPRSNRSQMAIWGAGIAAALVLTVSSSAFLLGQKASQAPGPVAAVVDRGLAGSLPSLGVAVKGFFQATTPEEKAAFVRGGETLLPAMQEYYASHPDEPNAVQSATAEPYRDEAGEFLFVRSVVDGTPFQFMMEARPEGLIDWRSLTGQGELTWEQWMEQRPTQPVSMRVWAALDDYHNGEFSDASRFLCLKISSPDGKFSAWAYVERSLEAARNLEKVLGGGKMEAATSDLKAGEVWGLSSDGPSTRLLGSFVFPESAALPAALPQVKLVHLTEGGWLDRSPAILASQ